MDQGAQTCERFSATLKKTSNTHYRAMQVEYKNKSFRIFMMVHTAVRWRLERKAEKAEKVYDIEKKTSTESNTWASAQRREGK